MKSNAPWKESLTLKIIKRRCCSPEGGTDVGINKGSPLIKNHALGTFFQEGVLNRRKRISRERGWFAAENQYSFVRSKTGVSFPGKRISKTYYLRLDYLLEKRRPLELGTLKKGLNINVKT